MTLPARVLEEIRGRELFPRRARILLAVSGGLDSMVMLHVLCALSANADWKLFVAHFNHQLRGRSSDADERIVRAESEKRGLAFSAGRGAVKTVAKQQGISLEMAGRELRHEFLAATARRLRCAIVVTAHHADDQVEHFFLRLLRGASGEGLAGMKWKSASPVDAKLQIVRPLLGVSKAELLQFAKEERIRYRDDASNATTDILRNRLRHELLPLLRQEYQPGLDRTILRLMEIVGGEAEVVKQAAQAWLANSGRQSTWQNLPVGVQRRVIQLQLQTLRSPTDYDLVEFLRTKPGQITCVAPERYLVCAESGKISWARPDAPTFREQTRKLNLSAQARVIFSGLEVHWEIKQRPARIPRQPQAASEYFDAEKVGAKVVLRHWQPGDRFRPIGMKAAVKLQDWFTNQKIPRTQRHALVVAATAHGDIFWVEGQRIGEACKLTSETRKVLIWAWRRGKGRSPALRGF